MIRDNVFRELLSKTFGAQVVSIDVDGHFEVVSFKALPPDLAQMSIKFTADIQVDPVLTGTTKFTYWFHPAAQDTFGKVLNHELEKKRYIEFSETFDKEVQSELGQ